MNKSKQKSINISDVNKQILEIKKKIQLSEGQRKALFEVREAEYKTNCNEIAKLKKDIADLVVLLKEQKSNSAKHRIKSGRLKSAFGALNEKSSWVTQEMLDLHVIDKSKQLNLMRYQVKKQQMYLSQLANQYQILVTETSKKMLFRKVENPFKIVSTELQNQIHAVKIQFREAVHVNNRYKDITSSLRQDAARFKFNIQCAESQQQSQNVEIQRLQKILEEASEMRGRARSALIQQEKGALNAAKARDQQETEGKQLVQSGKQELEKLERRIFQSGKTLVRAEAAEAIEINVIQEVSSATPQSEDRVVDIFEDLKQITGAVSTEEVVERFRAQKETDIRLNSLRDNSEIEKRQLEKNKEGLTTEHEQYKYAEAKDAELNLEHVQELHKLIKEQLELKEKFIELMEKTDGVIKFVGTSLDSLYRAVHPLSIVQLNPKMALQRLEEELSEVMAEINQIDNEEKHAVMIDRLDIDEDKWLPPPYSGLIRRTPIPQEETSPVPQPTGSDDEEEVPTRGYLKRQAQLVVDARSRRKNLRFQRK
ncbi:hypothetical protein RN001_006253 [Aquatica leii]|uniref:Coiled-coil domain-containing protein 151 n=1 Tax=Aquatica leii TaxID=1421715 RepID=A0AAN7Q1J6_9COLE|nr:hypothetical protein RN001_006253 [Aquatica leii]